jgi:hypothetical protein
MRECIGRDGVRNEWTEERGREEREERGRKKDAE